MADSEAKPDAAGPGASTRAGESRPNPADQVVQVGRSLAGAIRRGAATIGSRRGVPIALAGAVVVALAWIGERDSAWGFPMLLTGAAMIGLGLMGPRMSGSLSVRWGDDGAYLQLTSVLAPPGERREAPSVPAPTGDAGADLPAKLVPPTEIEGEGETIEFNAEAVKAALGVRSVGVVRDGAPAGGEAGEEPPSARPGDEPSA